MHHHAIVREINEANPYRGPDCVRRRLLKVLEEVGEASEAYLSRTGRGNYKDKTWNDYREEAIDSLIVLIDVALTEFDEFNFPPAALLPNHLLEASQNGYSTFFDLESRTFAIARAVCRADEHMMNNDLLGFYGALARGIKAAAEIAYARMPDDDGSDVAGAVYQIVQRKLAKWTSRMNAPVPSTTAFVSNEIKDHMESIEDKNA